jgi:glutathione S-transferase
MIMPILHGIPVSPYVRKVQAVLNTKGIDYSINPIIPFGDKTELLSLNPLGKIPVYQDESVTLGDSSVICAYLEKNHPTTPLYPTNASDYANALWLERYADTHIALSLGTVFFQRVLNPKMFDTPTDEEALAIVINDDVPVIFDYLESQLGSNEYFVANTLSIADFAIAAPFVNAAAGGLTVDNSRWPNLAAFVARIFALPAFITKIEL